MILKTYHFKCETLEKEKPEVAVGETEYSSLAIYLHEKICKTQNHLIL